jgi:hypothetical protein
VPAAERERERAPERQPGDVRPVQTHPLDEHAQAIGVVGHSEVVRRIG